MSDRSTWPETTHIHQYGRRGTLVESVDKLPYFDFWRLTRAEPLVAVHHEGSRYIITVEEWHHILADRYSDLEMTLEAATDY
jgi:hypothetical protein